MKSRLFLVPLDSSKSYKDYEAAIQGLITTVNNLGPGDRLAIARITEKLVPKDFILLDARTKRPRDEVFAPSRNIEEWRRRQRELGAAWQQVAEQGRTIASGLQRLKGGNTAGRTDLHGAIEYSALWLSSQPDDEKTLIVCSDLEHDTGKPTFDPPAGPIDVNNLRVKLLFTTYRDGQHWKKIDAAWKKYFSRAEAFEMLDSGRGTGAILPPSPVPRKLPPPTNFSGN